MAAGSGYKLEISDDDARTWRPAGGLAMTPVFTLSGLINGKKYHARIFATNAEYTSAAGQEYPLYITQDTPPPPDGLCIELAAGSARLTWGEVLGVTEYRLYRRKRGQTQFTVVYFGRAMAWKDVDASILPSTSSPRDAADTGKATPAEIEYCVASSNHNGEGKRSRIVNTDPVSWRNWNPNGDEPFRRTVERTEGPLPNDGIGRYYPD